MTEYKNPNQEPSGLSPRLLMALAITFLVLAFGQQLMVKYAPKPAQPQSAAPQEQPPAAPQAFSQTPAAAASAPGTKPPVKPIAIKQATEEAETVIENGLYRITFTNRGGQVKSWILKNYLDDAGHPLELTHPVAAPEFGYPLSLFTYDEGLRNKLNTALYVPNITGNLQAPAEVAFDYADGETVARKSFRFDHSYLVRVETSVTHKGENVAAYPAWPAGLGDQNGAPSFASSRLEWSYADKIERQTPKNISGGNTINGPFYWAGVVDQYFAAVFLPDNPAQTAMMQFHNAIPRNPQEPDTEKRKKDIYPVLGAAVGSASGTTHLRLFVGPKNLDVLKSVRSYQPGASTGSEPDGPNLEGVVDFGFFGFIAKPLFLWLQWTHAHWVANWGWAIMVLTLIINVALFPLRFSSMKSALKQQKVAPEVKSINKRYEGMKLTDPRQHEKQKEIQALYKREGINPMGGCLPMLIQFPFLFAFYAMLGAATELRHAQWLWVHDLASSDPLHILPIAIVISMYIMQKATPMTGMDPAQAKMMQTMMPLMIGFISWSLPAGLGVYWVAGNIIGYLQQVAVNQTTFAREIRAHLEKREEKRAAKKR